jgi:hypothetical protein
MQIQVIRVIIQIRGTPTRGREMLHNGATQESNPIRRDFTKPHREILHHNNHRQQGNSGQRTPCQKCGKFHAGNCLFGQLVCYRYGKPGHIIIDCKAPINNSGGKTRHEEQKTNAIAWVYALTLGDALASNEVVTGTLPISNDIATILFDPGAMHSFISNSFAKSCSLKLESLGLNLSVATSVGKTVVCTSVIRRYLVTIKGHVMPENLVIFEMSGFDVILGMDWLSMYHACVDCFHKK